MMEFHLYQTSYTPEVKTELVIIAKNTFDVVRFILDNPTRGHQIIRYPCGTIVPTESVTKLYARGYNH